MSMEKNTESRRKDGASLQVEKLFSFSTGAGKESYSKNSQMQAAAVSNLVLPDLSEALQRVPLPLHTARSVVVVDLGCASGANTMNVVTNIVEDLRTRVAKSKRTEPLEFQAFFNDLPSNDFNNLFHLLSTKSIRTRDFFAAGVPGSFYGRLFPLASVNVFFSANCLHWISRIPPDVEDRSSPAYNKGNLWVHGANVATRKAYQEQALGDLTSFLQARAAELVPGGLLFLFFSGRPSFDTNGCFDESIKQATVTLQNEAWGDLIAQGVLTEEQRDTFNVPLYYRSHEDVKEAVESCALDCFHIHTLKTVNQEIPVLDVWQTKDSAKMSKKIALMIKSGESGLTEAHIGREASELLWERYEKVVEEKLVPVILNAAEQDERLNNWYHIVSLIRK